MSPGYRGVITVALASLTILGVLAGGLSGHLPRTFADPATPPPPPSFIPTPIGTPPGPPTPIPTATASPTAGSAATTTPTPAATATAAATVDFSLDAVRVSKVNNPGDMVGLSAVKPGTKVWLMLYYTIKTLTKPAQRVTAYDLEYGGKVIYRITYKHTVKPPSTGRFSFYSPYVLPSSLPYGHYIYRATLTLAKRTQTKTWKFDVARYTRVAGTTGQ